MTQLEYLKQFISNFITASGNKNTAALLESLADEAGRLQDASIAVTNQLSISTASDVYLDKRLAEVGITRPSELGMDDLAFRKMGIQVNQAKQITNALHTVLSTFYGDEAVRASTTSGLAAPYDIEEGDDLIFQLEDGITHVLTVEAASFENPSEAKAEELVDVITRYIRALGYDGYAQVYLDVDSGDKYVKIFGGAKGPYGFVQILGGRVQNKLEFSQIRGTELPLNTTVWEITRNSGSTYRFRWVSGPQPRLDKVFVGDKVMIYGSQFNTAGFDGTFGVTKARPAQLIPSYDSGYFEIEIPDFSTLQSSAADQAPPPNTITQTYSITLTQSSFDDLKFFLPKRNTSYSQQRYALAWEPKNNLLKVYMPATTKVVRRDLIGSGHCHLLYTANDFNGSFGSATVDEAKVIVLSPRSIKFKKSGYDNLSYGGTLTVGLNTYDIEYVFREGGYAYVFTKTDHGITGVADQWGQVKSTAIVSVSTVAPEDDQSNPFLGPYVVDTEAKYSLTSQIVTSREKILAGESKTSLSISGILPNEEGMLLLGLNKDEQEGPVKYFASQVSGAAPSTNIGTISQASTTVTVNTLTPHGIIAGQDVVISGTASFNGTWTVDSVPSATTFLFSRPTAILFETSGLVTPQLEGSISSLILDPSYIFKYNHAVGEDITLISEQKAYEPSPDGVDYSFYITGTADGRVFAAQLMEEITALGIKLEIVVIYPSDRGLGYEGGGTDGSYPTSEKIWVWGV